MSKRQQIEGVAYVEVDAGYFEKRRLRRYAGVGSLWALGVGAVISYGLQMVSFILLRRRLPDIERPYRSPFGVPGALVALAISGVTFVTLFAIDPIYRSVALGAAAWFLLGLIYFAVYGRRQLVYSPEERFALDAAQRGGDSG